MDNLPKLNVGVYISEISPRSGSILGGTVLTIKGDGFEDLAATLVQVELEFCRILSVNRTQIQCIVPPKAISRDGTLKE